MASSSTSKAVVDVWSTNLDSQFRKLDVLVRTFPMIAVDCEFPGFLINTAREASESQRYADLKFNVDNLKIIQLGFTIFDRNGNVGGCWQFNFRNFDSCSDVHVPASIELLKSNGIDFDRNKRDGIDVAVFSELFKDMLKTQEREKIFWFTFHGLYDMAYVLKLVGAPKLPETLVGFLGQLGYVFGSVYDVKFMARYCHGLSGGELGLKRLAEILRVDRVGNAHQAGSDSLLTACVYSKMKTAFGLIQESFQGFLYGISAQVVARMEMDRGSNHNGYGGLLLHCPTYDSVSMPQYSGSFPPCVPYEIVM